MTGHFSLTGTPEDMTPQPKAHIGANQVIGFKRSIMAGVMYLGESMHADLRGSGIEVQVGNPGFIKTRLTDKNDFKMPFLMEAEPAARLMAKAIFRRRREYSFPFIFSRALKLMRVIPFPVYHFVIKRIWHES